MLTDPKERSPRNPSRIDLNERSELDYWCEKLGVSHDDLETIVREVGNRVEDVESRLGPRIDIGTGG